ncbi:hypothetical protein R3W88_019869 [Solanum pinnatisectum]|uniref:Uncharacterized protein n=1 Tax=Solanum pinnatisectum TaxID=50273 RepID=A0AAV9KKQ0_9SOLN|nr:hypothetical protein R3W88_019869 [Solanum pinnatisectum]
MAKQLSVSEHTIEIGRPKKKLIVPSSVLEGMKHMASSMPSSPSGQPKSANKETRHSERTPSITNMKSYRTTQCQRSTIACTQHVHY